MAVKRTPMFKLSYGPATIDYGWDGNETRMAEVWKMAGVDPAEWIENGPTSYGTIGGEPIGKSDLARAQIWAESFIAQTTDYVVTGWHGMAPVLEIQAYYVTFVMSGGEISATIPKNAFAHILSRFECPATYSAEFPDGTVVEVPRSRETVTVDLDDGSDTIVTINLNNVSHIMRQKANRVVEVVLDPVKD